MRKPIDPHLRDIDPFEGVEAGDSGADENLDESTIERRATQGVGLLVGQMFALQILTLGVTIVLARILTVADYGVFAIAIAIQQAGHALVELGVPASLINRAIPPDEHDQRAVTGFVLASALAVCALVFVIAWVVLPLAGASGHVVQLAFIACLALPILAFRTIPTVLLERRLRYGRVTVLYTADTITFNLAALAGFLAGWGGYALVAGVPAGAFAGLVAAWLMQRAARGVTWDFKVIRPMISFGSQVSARQGIVLARDLTFVGLIAAIGGQSAAGFYAMSQRILGVPLAFSLAMGRVGFPAMARSEGDDVRIHSAARSVAIAATAIGLPLAVCAGAAEPLLDTLFGSRWIPAADVVIPSAAGLLLMASFGSIISSLYFSLGNARLPMVSSIVDSLVLCGSAVILIQWNSTTGTGIAVLLGALAGILVLASKAASSVRWSMLPLFRSFVIAGLAAGAGLFCPVQTGITGLIACAAAATVVWLVLTAIFARTELKTIFGLVLKGLRRVPANEVPAGPAV